MEYKRLIITLSNFSKFFSTTEKYDTKNINQINNAITKWTNSHKNIKIHSYKPGDIYKIEFGLAYEPEMGFEHRAVILGKSDKLYYVVPITTYNKNNPLYSNAYHPIENPNGNKKYYLIKQSEYPRFLDHDSIIKCNDIKTVSYKRFANKKLGYIESDDFEEILNTIYQNVFITIDYKTKQQMKLYEDKINELEEQNKLLNEKINNMIKEEDVLEGEDISLD